jgi:hypothetical protein
MALPSSFSQLAQQFYNRTYHPSTLRHVHHVQRQSLQSRQSLSADDNRIISTPAVNLDVVK